ncbi:MAG: hypothetical protein IJZ53_01350 [Tyzzerella sp.]|nr:hypothetical protein [Tyzzerella sp.]
MKQKVRAYLKKDSGEVMLESTIIMVFTLLILIAMLSVGFLFYQQAMINTVATDLASDIATSYKLTNQDIGEGEVTSTALNDVKLYRTSVSMFSMKALHKQRAEEYLPERIQMSTLGIAEKEPVLEEFDIAVDNVGRMHVELTVSMECDILFSGALKYFGIIDSTPRFSARASAECLDITAYASHVKFLDYVGRKAEETLPNGNKAITSIIGIFQDADSIADMLLGN